MLTSITAYSFNKVSFEYWVGLWAYKHIHLYWGKFKFQISKWKKLLFENCKEVSFKIEKLFKCKVVQIFKLVQKLQIHSK